MNRVRWIMVLLLAACQSLPSGEDPVDPGADAPAGCEEVARVEVEDRTAPAGTLAYAVGDTLVDAGGLHVGIVEPAEGEAAPATVTFAFYTVWAVDLELAGPGGADTGPAMGAPVPVCADVYLVDLELGLDASPLLAVAARVEGVVEAPGSLTWSAEVAWDAVGGDARPAGLDPGDWDTLTLGVAGAWGDPAWSGALTWHASGGGEAKGEGTVPVSGATEPLGTWFAG